MDTLMFSRNLKILRSKNHLTQEELAQKLHVVRQTVSNWECGKGDVSIYDLDHVSKIFNVSLDKLMYNPIIENDVKVEDQDYLLWLMNDYIRNVSRKGYYNFYDEDFENFFGIIKFDFERIVATALMLSKLGYKIIDIYANGFSVYFTSDAEAAKFHIDIDGICENFIHNDNKYLLGTYKEISNSIANIYDQWINKSMSSILGCDMKSMKYFWVDEMENTRGYAETEEECRNQAQEQQCDSYTILPICR